MKKTLAFALLGLVFAVPAAAGKGPTYGELPSSALGARPATKPKAIAARESIPGIRSKVVKTPSEATAVVLAFDTTTGKPATKASDVGGCISAGPSRTTEFDGPSDAELFQEPKSGVVPVRAEKLVEGSDGTAKLEIADAWFDPRSRGLKLIGRSTLALKPYATIPGGTRIFAGRDEHAGKKLVQFVVAEAKDTPAYLLAEERAVSTRVGTESTTQSLGMCSHHRIGIPAGGAGESVSFDLKVILPPLANGERSNVVSDLHPLSEWEKKSGAKDVRTRSVRIQFGVSQTSRDKDPVLSVSTEWSSDEAIERVYTEREATFQAHQSFRFPVSSDEDNETPLMRGSDLF